MKNREIAEIFEDIAEILEIKGENPFRIRAYQKASRNIEGLAENIEEIAQQDKLEEIPGIGRDLAGKIKEYLSSGKITQYEELRKEIPSGLIDMLKIPGLGPKTAKLIYEKLGLQNLAQLQKAAKEHRLLGLPGIKEKTEENILKGIQHLERSKQRMLLPETLVLAREVIAYLKGKTPLQRIEYAGSLRRGKETVGDIDLVASAEAEKIGAVVSVFCRFPGAEKVLAQGETKGSIVTKEERQVDLRVVEDKSYGAALQYFTGSQEHNVALRELAGKKKYKINEYGLFKVNGREKYVAGTEEQEIYEKLGMEYIPPELRENRGEIEAAQKHRLPELVTEQDIKGDLHVHSHYSDGYSSILEIAQKARSMGREWVVISDHSTSLKVANGVEPERLYKKMEEIKKINQEFKNFRVFCGSEVDIFSDGKLDYPDDLLSQLDFIIASIHTGFKQTEQQITARIIKAMENKNVDIIGHPTGRLLGQREPYQLNMEEILKYAKLTGTALEINAYPDRLDLYDIYCKKAKEMGIMLGIGTDTHILDQLKFMSLGVLVARRGWLEKKDLLNTLSADEFIKKIKKG